MSCESRKLPMEAEGDPSLAGSIAPFGSAGDDGTPRGRRKGIAAVASSSPTARTRPNASDSRASRTARRQERVGVEDAVRVESPLEGPECPDLVGGPREVEPPPLGRTDADRKRRREIKS